MVQTTTLAEKKGVILQNYVNAGRPLQWAIYLFHFIELPFHHLFSHVDVETKVYNLFYRPIRQQFMACEALPVEAFDFEPTDCASLDVDLVF